MDAIDESALSSLFDKNDAIEPEACNQTAPGLVGINLSHNETAEFKEGNIIVTKLIDDDLVMTYTYGEKPKALPPLHQVKLNDPISGNIPFKQNVSDTKCKLRVEDIIIQ